MSRTDHINSTLNHHKEVKKIYCAYHPNQHLTNFCCQIDCLMPLCPNCIVEHTQQHFIQSTKPTYVNVLEAISETKQKCYQNIVVFQELSKSNDKIYDYVLGLRESIHNQLVEDKQDIYKYIDSLFQNYEEKLFEETIAHYKKMEVYDRRETTSISQFITEQIEIIHEQIGILKGENCLAGLINFYKNDGKVYEESIKDIAQYVNKHKQVGKISINCDTEKLKQYLEGFCQKNLVVEFINQESAKEEEKMKSSQFDKEGKERKGLASKLAKNQSSSTIKENNMNHGNHDYRNLVKRSEDYYRIDPVELKPGKYHQSSSYRPTIASTRQRY